MAEREIFETSFSRTFAKKLHDRELGELVASIPWESLEPTRYPPELVARARFGWTENAFNEQCTGATMGQLLAALGQARAPIDLWSMASRFVLEEVIHVELCSRVAMQLGGGIAISYEPDDVLHPLDPDLDPLERATELVVCVCCVGEAVSFPLLSGCMRSATHPVTKAVLTKIVQDEALHGQLGWAYLDWIGSELRPAERDRLAQAARRTLRMFDSIFESRSRVKDGLTSEGFRVEDVRELGWMIADDYAALAKDAVKTAVIEPLASYGIRL